MVYLSVVIPVYKAEGCVRELYNRLKSSLESITEDFEIIMVEDGGDDHSWDHIIELSQLDKRVKAIKLSRNFGQHYAITAGLDNARGEWIVVMDCDLQDRPEEIPRLYAKAREGYEVVFARRLRRQDKFLKRYFSRAFYLIFGYLTNTKQDSSIANFGIYHSKVIQSIKQMGDSIRCFPFLVRWVGFNVSFVDVQHGQRTIGNTSYTLKKSLNLSLDVMLSFSYKPLKLAVITGFSISLISFLYAIYIIIRAIQGKIGVLGWSSLIVLIWFLSGMIILILGIVGLYVGKAFEQAKNRPKYIIKEIYNK